MDDTNPTPGTEPHLWGVLLMGERNPAAVEKGFRIVEAHTPEAAVAEIHPVPPSTFAVNHALVFRLAEPWAPVRVHLRVSSEWGHVEAAMPSQRDRLELAARARRAGG